MNNKRTPDEWKNEIIRYQKSGLSFNGYCRENNISPSTLMHWKKKFTPASLNVEKKLVKISTQTSRQRKMRLSCGEISVEFPVDIAANKIVGLISALKDI